MNNYIEPVQEIRVAVDAVCIAETAEGKFILLMKRRYPPFKDSWALPGGFLLNNEELETGVLRELSEETNLDTSNLKPIEVGVFGKVGRDPRRRIISVAYLIKLNTLSTISTASESLEVEWKNLADLQNISLAFDHKEIISKALAIL